MKIAKALSAMVLVCAMTATPAMAVGKPTPADANVKTATVTHTETAMLPMFKGGKNEQKSTNREQSPKPIMVEDAVVTVKKHYWQVPLSHDLQDYIAKLCAKYEVSQKLVYGVMKTESSFDSSKISNTGDWGLMQINRVNRPWLAQKFGITDWFNPYQNVEAGIYLLSQLSHKYHDTTTILIAYNCGEGGMKSLYSRGIWSTSYSRKVELDMYTLSKNE